MDSTKEVLTELLRHMGRSSQSPISPEDAQSMIEKLEAPEAPAKALPLVVPATITLETPRGREVPNPDMTTTALRLTSDAINPTT